MEPDRERVDPLYAAVRAIARFWLWFFWKSVEVRGAVHVPPAGPVLLCINHPNNLIDSLLVGAVLRRKVHYLATSQLFRNPLVARFLTACNRSRRPRIPAQNRSNRSSNVSTVLTRTPAPLKGRPTTCADASRDVT